MELPNETAKGIANLSYHECDARVKQLLANKAILAQIVKGCTTEFKDIPANEIAEKYIEGTPEVSTVPVNRDETNSPYYRKSGRIQGYDTEDTTDTEGTVYYDIRFSALAPSGNGKIGLMINIEAQERYHPGYPIVCRGEYYCCRMISAQKGLDFENSDYGNIKKVYSIWICYNAPGAENTMTRYRITKEDMIGHVEEPESNYDKMQVVILGLGEPRKDDAGTVLHFLDVLFSTQLKPREIMEELEKSYRIPMTEQLEEEMNVMCNFSHGFEERGILKGMEKGMEKGMAKGMEKGMAQGMEKGMAQGMAQGVLKGELGMLFRLVKKNILSIREASDEAGLTEQQFTDLMAAQA